MRSDCSSCGEHGSIERRRLRRGKASLPWNSSFRRQSKSTRGAPSSDSPGCSVDAHIHAPRVGLPGSVGRLGWMRRRAWMLAFSSVEMTNSSSRSDRPSQARAYRSGMRAGRSSSDAARAGSHPRAASARFAIADARHQPVLPRVAPQVAHAQARQRHLQRRRQLARQRLDLNAEIWWEKPGGVLSGVSHRVPAIVP
jgi:hypothetical protein